KGEKLLAQARPHRGLVVGGLVEVEGGAGARDRAEVAFEARAGPGQRFGVPAEGRDHEQDRVRGGGFGHGARAGGVHITRSSAQARRRPVRNSLCSRSTGSWTVRGLKFVLTALRTATMSASG